MLAIRNHGSAGNLRPFIPTFNSTSWEVVVKRAKLTNYCGREQEGARKAVSDSRSVKGKVYSQDEIGSANYRQYIT